MDKFGRRTALVLLSIPCIIGWLIVGITGLFGARLGPELAVSMIYSGRVLQGLGTGIVAGASRVYTSEVRATLFYF
jgi:MFS family permease